jgi:septal ring factor EnvC (AmiA/AmiB activator)
MDFDKYAKETLETYQGELKKVQESINLHVGELDMLKKSEQRLMGAIASVNDMLLKKEEEKEKKKAKA